MNSIFQKIYTKIILQTKQQFSLLQYKSELMHLFDQFLKQIKTKNIEINQLIDDYVFEVKFYLYKALRFKPKTQQLNNIDNDLLNIFHQNVIKNIQQIDDLTTNWAIYFFSYDKDFDRYEYRKTFNRYITPNIEYTKEDLIKLQHALIKLNEIINAKAASNNTSLAVKYNPYFNQYFQQNDNIKLYCFKQADVYLLEQIQKQFLQLLSNKTNNRIYYSGFDEKRSYGQIIAINIAKDILTFASQNYINSQQIFEYLNENFQQQIKKFTK